MPMKNLGDTDAGQFAERYDRQLRIWGDGGQTRLREANILILGSGATATEALRNLVLPGVGRFVLVDDLKVLQSDLSENFLVSPEDLGDFRCRAVSKRALELNPAVSGEAWAISPHEYLAHHARPRQQCGSSKEWRKALRFSFLVGDSEGEECCPPSVCEFDLVISSLMPAEDEREILRICGECGIPQSSTLEGRIVETCPTTACQEIPPAKRQVSRQVPLVYLGSLGFFGWVRLWAGEYCLVETKPESSPVDLRIANPFPELLEFASRFDLEAMDDEQHSHVPFIVILIQAVCRYRGLTLKEASAAASKGNLEDIFNFPLPTGARKNIHDIVVQMRRSEEEANFQEALDNVYRAVEPTSHCDCLDHIINRASTMDDSLSPFWRMARALHKMLYAQGSLPVCPLSMDMTSDTSSYVALQRIYAEKAAKDELMMRDILINEEHHSRMRDQVDEADVLKPPKISKEELQCFCRNAASIKVIRYPAANENHFGSASLRLLASAAGQMRLTMGDACATDYPEDCGYHHLPWYAAVLACKLAADKLGRFPGTRVTQSGSLRNEEPATTTSEMCSDVEAVAAELRKVEDLVGCSLLVSNDIIKQVVGYRGSEFPTTAALIGGVAAQEAIKLLCKQFEPINNTFLWNGTERRGLILEL